MCKCENKIGVEVFGDYDGILYYECQDCGKKVNRFTGIEFDEGRQRTEYGTFYQFKDGELVGYSKHLAKGLTLEDDLTLSRNLLWGTRGIDGDKELVFKPIHSLSIPHIKAIIRDGCTRNPEYLDAFTQQLTNVITIRG